MQGIDRFVGSFLVSVSATRRSPVEAASPMSHVSTSIRNCGPEERAIVAEACSPSVRSPTTHNSRASCYLDCRAKGGRSAYFASRLGDLVATKRVIGAGPGTIATGRRLQQGIPWNQAGEPAPYCGNGAAMRVAPLGVSGPTILRASCNSGEPAGVTHHDRRCAAGAVAIAAASTRSPAGPIGWTFTRCVPNSAAL